MLRVKNEQEFCVKLPYIIKSSPLIMYKQDHIYGESN